MQPGQEPLTTNQPSDQLLNILQTAFRASHAFEVLAGPERLGSSVNIVMAAYIRFVVEDVVAVL